MRVHAKRIGVTALAGLAVLGLAAPEARAQFFRQRTLGVYSSGVNPNSPFYNPVMPLYRAGPGTSMQQAMYNQFAPLYATARLPPWMFGYNPYPSPVQVGSPYPPVAATPAYNPYAATPYLGNPYAAPAYAGNPYAAGAAGPAATSGDASNPYAAALSAPAGNYNPYTPYASDPYSGYLYGSADMLRAQGTLMLDQEKARIMRELAHQAQIDTKKKQAEFEWWYEANRPRLHQIMAKNLEGLVKRIQSTATPGEIQSGKAENILLDDLAKHADKKSSAAAAPLDEDLLRRINITTPDGANLGLLRNEGQFAWPASLVELVPEEDRGQIDSLAKSLYELAAEKKLKPALLRDLELRVRKLQEMLSNKVNEIPSGQFVEARRFLNELQSATRALGVPELVPSFVAWQRFARGGKTVQDVVDFLNSRGLRVAPATPGDEGAYLALHSALANYDIASQAEVASSR